MQTNNWRPPPLSDSSRRICSTRWLVLQSLFFLAMLALFFCFFLGVINFLFLLIGIVALVLAQLVNIFISRSQIAAGKTRVACCTGVLVIALTVPIMLLVNVRSVDYAGTYFVVYFIEQYLSQKVDSGLAARSNKNDHFKYMRFDFGRVAATKRWVVFDESDQVRLDYQMRDQHWWAVSNETQEAEGCMTNGITLYSHFYIQYSSC